MDTRCEGEVRIHNHFTNIEDTIAQRRRRAVKSSSGPPPERRNINTNAMTNSHQLTRMRNLSGGSSGSTASGSSSGSSIQLDNQYSSADNPLHFLDIPPFANSSPSTSPPHRGESSSSHRKLDRSLSDSDSDRSGSGSQSQRSVNSSRYKTELCRPFEESGSCKYGDKCQFAHGAHELRNLTRHPKYKTELCRTFHTIGFCPYGPRCHFIHEDDKSDGSCKLSNSSGSGSNSPSLSPTGNEHDNFSYCSESTSQMNIENTQINNSLMVNINNYGNLDAQSLEQRFNSSLNLNRQRMESSRNLLNNANSCSKAAFEENDIFSSISVFNPDEVVDNASKPSNSNCPTYVDTYIWSNVSSQNVAPADPFHYSPTGSTGSSSSSSGSESGSSSDCRGSTESLVSCLKNVDWRQPFLPFNLVH